jgi:hypothetical protein
MLNLFFFLLYILGVLFCVRLCAYIWADFTFYMRARWAYYNMYKRRMQIGAHVDYLQAWRAKNCIFFYYFCVFHPHVCRDEIQI